MNLSMMNLQHVELITMNVPDTSLSALVVGKLI